MFSIFLVTFSSLLMATAARVIDIIPTLSRSNMYPSVNISLNFCCLNGDLCSKQFVTTMFDRDFSVNTNGVSILINDDSSATLLTSFDTMYSLNYCGRKASELSSKFSKHQCLFLSGDDLELKQSFVDQLLRCLLHNCSDVNRKISFIVDLTNCSSGSLTGDDVSVARLLKSWAAEVVADYPAVSVGDIDVFLVRLDDPSSVDSARAYLKRSAAASLKEKQEEEGGRVDRQALELRVQALLQTYASVDSQPPRIILSTAYKRSMFTVESTYTSLLSKFEAMSAPWHQRVGSGRLVVDFGTRARELHRSLLAAYRHSTADSIAIRERAARAQQLSSFVVTSCTALLRNQLFIAQTEAVHALKNKLLRLVSVNPTEESESELISERKAAAAKQLEEFEAQMASLCAPDIGLLLGQEAIQDFNNTLQGVARDFPDSPEAKLEGLRRLERVVQKSSPTSKSSPRRRKGLGFSRWGINVALSLVGMLRPPGFGNLQGYMGYSTSMLGLPLDLLLGVQNDGDSPEVLGEDREHPLLRLQPKFHFDVNLK